MEEKLEKKLKAFLPYIIIIGIVYLLSPALLFTDSDAVAYIILIGLLPLTAILCCLHYSLKQKNDFALSLVAPLFFIPAMFIYPIARESFLKAVIYLIAYFLCGYLGLTVGDILKSRKGVDGPERSERREPIVDDEPSSAEARPTSSQIPRRVAVDADEPAALGASDPYQDSSLDASTTEDDIEAILREIHQRRSSEQ